MMKKFSIILSLILLGLSSVICEATTQEGDPQANWEVKNYKSNEQGISLELLSKDKQALASLLFFSSKELDEARDKFLKELQKGVSVKRATFLGEVDVNKWTGYKYISAGESLVQAHLTVIIPCGGSRVLIADIAVPVGSLNAKVNWSRIQSVWIAGYNKWVDILARRRI